MGRTKTIDIQSFYEDYFINKLDKKSLISKYDICELTYLKYVQLVKSLQLTEINTETLEKEVLRIYNMMKTDDKIDLLKIMCDIWKSKGKVPNKTTSTIKDDETLNGLLSLRSSTPVNSQK